MNAVKRPEPGAQITIVVNGEMYVGTLLDFDESGEFGLVWWEDRTRDYRYLHWGYDEGMNETMEWSE